MAPDPTAGLPELSEDFYRTLLDNLADGVYFVDTDRRITYWNVGAERLSGHLSSTVVGRHCWDNILDHVDESGRRLCMTTCPLLATIQDGDVRETQVWLRHREGWRRPVRVRTAPIRDLHGSIVGGVETFEDDTAVLDARKDADAARHDALRDTLTSLPNRRYLDTVMHARLEARSEQQPLLLLFIDVDAFKAVNDGLGHVAGDALLRGVAASLAGALRPGDFLARWGGDEFAVLSRDTDAHGAAALGERLRSIVSAMRLPGIPRVTLSVGGAFSRAGDDTTSFTHRADGALYAAKRSGRNRVVVAGDGS